MEIVINQKMFSIVDKYQIFIDGRQTHTASTKFFCIPSKTNLFEVGCDVPKYVIKKKWDFTVSFELIKWDNNVFKFRTMEKEYWKKLHFYCQVGQDIYEVFGHRGRKFSVYKNDTQIAWWDKNAVVLFNGDIYKIIADKDCDHELIISFCLIIDKTFSNNKSGATLTIDHGSVRGKTVKDFDLEWRPKH